VHKSKGNGCRQPGREVHVRRRVAGITAKHGVGHPGMITSQCEKDWEKAGVIFTPLTQK